MNHTALFWDKADGGRVLCRLCPHRCIIPDQAYGICGVRFNDNGRLVSLNYGRIAACSADPIEKKPLYHFLPGSLAYSISAPGCNFRCGFCQNSGISQLKTREKLEDIREVSPESVVSRAISSDCASIAYTYTEPTVFFEYALDCARLAKAEELKNIFVTNGYISSEALLKIAPFLDAANIDLKYSSQEFYEANCGGGLKPVLDTIKLMLELGIWVEVTTLIIPGENDDLKSLSDIANYISSLGKNIPWHISKYFPSYKYSSETPPTSIAALEAAEQAGRASGLKYIYKGNTQADNSTYCPECSALLIERSGYSSELFNIITENRCASCGFKIDLIL
ncbi:MAG: AmmeMemoRadiSam system radical SAM enzyme [Elusimicrobia bacterium]|nr:AmmeMemoRadiSam system radical SAM enzyme [Elusimicrobiota bacterium]